MNVAIFASAFHPSLGGVEELVRQLVHAYARRNVRAIVLTNRWPRSLPELENYEGIAVYRPAMRSPDGSIKARLGHLLTHLQTQARIRNILRENQIDLLHVQCVSINAHYALKAGRDLKLPVVVTSQGERTMDANRLFEHSTFAANLMHRCLNTAAHITTCSADVLRDLEQFHGKPMADRATVIYNGVNPTDFASDISYPHQKPYIFAIGRFVPQKGFDVLLRAFAAANPAGHDLLLAGDGPEKNNLEALSRELNLGDRVKFVGRADRAMAVSLFYGASFFAMPSRMEPQGIVNLEAMMAGKAIVASRTGGVPEIVLDGQTGLLVAPNDVADLSDAIKKLASDPALCDQLGNAGRLRAAQFDWDSIAGQYLRLYEKVLPG